MLLALALVLFASRAHAQQPAVAPSAAGTTIGMVVEVTDEWVLLRGTNGIPLRHWFKWVDVTSATPDQALLSAATKLNTGDKIEVRWSSRDNRELIESLAFVSAAPAEAAKEEAPKEEPTAPAAAAASNSVPVESSASATKSPASATTLAETFNGLIDNMLAAGGRILELPLSMFFGGFGLAGLGLAFAIRRYSLKGGRPEITRRLFVAEAALAVLAVAFVVDRKVTRLQTAVAELRSKTSADTAALLNTVSKLAAKRRTFLCDPAEVQKILAPQFGETSLRPLIYDEATDIVQVHFTRPLVQAYVAVIDLRNPALEIQLGVTLDKKKLASVFARETDCSVVINGEAGNSPAPDSGLGDWRGNMVRLGEALRVKHNRAGSSEIEIDIFVAR